MLAGSAETRRDFERGMSFAPPLILLIIALNVAMFAWEIAAGALQNEETITAAGALVRERVAAGEYWRLFSSMFLHGGVDHILGNCIVLYIVGMACEHALGFAQTAAVYFASAIGGSALSVALRPGPSVGASGAILVCWPPSWSCCTATVTAFTYATTGLAWCWRRGPRGRC